MRPESLDRINELAKLSRGRELSEDEKIEQKKLREEYVAGYKASLKSHLDNIVLVDKDGSREHIKDRIKKK